jgi:UDP-3-O-[3-hydroxymyristoyl] glucosamine N-acyltransferase
VAIVTAEPYTGWARVAKLFHPAPVALPGVHPSAVIDETAIIDPSADIGPLCVVEAGAEIGPGCRIGPSAVIGAGVVLGRDCRIGAHASVSHALLGERVYVYPGARIGQEGFGFAVTARGFETVPQLGRVLLHDDVEVGANSTVDRGSAGDTVIGAGSRLDNLVQIGHNVVLGRCCIIVAQVGISGSTMLGDFVQVGGQAAMAGHINIGDGAQIGAQAGVISDVDAGARMLGSPAQPSREFFRQVAVLKKLATKRDAN